MDMNKKIAAWVLAFASMGMGASIGAQESVKVEQSVTLTVDQAVDYALKNSRTLKSADIDLEMKERA
ncbi:MAG: TolC family protein, partial [Spirochaetaceae bacterium]|nr:TolC family protein [Spirochaetaceae bacterium]